MSASAWNILAVIEPDEALSLGLAAVLFGFLAFGLYASTTEEWGLGFRGWPSSGKEWIGYLGRAVLLLFLVLAYAYRLPGERWFSFKLFVSKGDLMQVSFWLLAIITPFCAWKQRRVFVFILIVLVLLALLFPAISVTRN